MRACNCGHADCLERLESAHAAVRAERLRPTEPGERMSTIHSSHGDFEIPKRYADAGLALDRVIMCSRSP